MNSRLGIASLSACALASLVMAGAGCKSYTNGSTVPLPTPSPSGSPSADTIYVQSSNITAKDIRGYRSASTDNGFVFAFLTLPTGDITNGDVVYDPASDTMWYAEANQSNQNFIEVWQQATTKNGMNPTLVPFPFGEGAATFDPTHHLLFVATTQGPQVSVYANAETMNATSTAAAVITLQINDGPSARPQEMLYDPTTDILFVSDQVTMVAVFPGFGAAANNAVISHTNPTIPATNYLQGLFSPDGLAYAPPPTDVLFVGEQQSTGDFVAVHNASTFNGPVGHNQIVTGFARPGGMVFDNIRGLLFLYDQSPVYVITNPITATGTINGLLASGSARVINDGATQNLGFGIALDPRTPTPSPSPSAVAKVRH